MSEAPATKQRQRHPYDDNRDPFTVPHLTAQRLLGVKHTKYWELVKSGEIEVIAIGKSTMAKFSSLKRLAEIA